MNKKFTTVALAVAMTIAAPLTAQAEGGNFYGSARVGISYSDAGGDSDATLDLRSWASRFGFQGETEMANGLTGFGKYEFAVGLPDFVAGESTNIGTRHAYIGIKGDFGQFTLGQTYHTWYNNVIGPIDQPWWFSCNGCIAYTGRTDALTYQGNFGAGTGGVSLYFSGEDTENELDGYEIGATFPVGGMSLGLGIQDIDNGTEPVLGLALSGTSGSIGWAFNVTSQAAPSDSTADDATGFDLYAYMGNTYIDIGSVSADDSSLGFTLGYTKPIGENTLTWFEINSFDSGAEGADSSLNIAVALKHDWK